MDVKAVYTIEEVQDFDAEIAEALRQSFPNKTEVSLTELEFIYTLKMLYDEHGAESFFNGLRRFMDFGRSLEAAHCEAKRIRESLADSSIHDFINMPPVSGLTLLALINDTDDENKAQAAAILERYAKPRREGGKATGKQRKMKAEADRNRVIEVWQSLAPRPENGRAKLIAERLGMPLRTVRDHIKKAGIRAPKRKTATS